MSYPCPRCRVTFCSKQVLVRHLQRSDLRDGVCPRGENDHQQKGVDMTITIYTELWFGTTGPVGYLHQAVYWVTL